jgi:hypothetical protein
METDIPLRALTEACAADLLPLLGVPQAEVLEVLSLDMPATSRRLDNRLLLRNQEGRAWLHLVEWQGYPDRQFLWRVLFYLGWLGINRTERPIAVTLVYLKPGDDVGSTLYQEIGGFRYWGVTFHRVRLWEEDAVAAVRSGHVGLAVLSPLMRDATAALVREAGQLVLAAEPDQRRQADLLNVLGALAESLVAPEQFIERFERKRLMESRYFEVLMHDKLEEERSALRAKHEEERSALEAQLKERLEEERSVLKVKHEAQLKERLEEERAALEAERVRERAVLEAERVRERAVLEAERAREEAARTLRDSLRRAVEDAISIRFPSAPLALATRLEDIQDPRQLDRLLRTALRAPDLEAIEHAMGEAAG